MRTLYDALRSPLARVDRRRAEIATRAGVSVAALSSSPTIVAQERPTEIVDNPIERLELLAGDDEAIASFLDQIDVTGPRDREMLGELARTGTLADPARFPAAHRRAVAALETLGRHGYHGSSAASRAGPAKAVVRWLVQLVARYVVVSYLRQTATDVRNLYWLREIETEPLSPDRAELQRARADADGLAMVFKRREIGLPSFVIGGLLIPVFATGWRLTQGVAFRNWWVAVITALVTVAVVVGGSWVTLRGAAMASRRIRLCTRAPLEDLWRAIGQCGRPPRDQSRKFAIIAITLTVSAWIILPAAVAIAFTN